MLKIRPDAELRNSKRYIHVCFQILSLLFLLYRRVSSLVKFIAISARGLRFVFRAGLIRCSVTSAVTLLRSCVVQALSRGYGTLQSLHAST